MSSQIEGMCENLEALIAAQHNEVQPLVADAMAASERLKLGANPLVDKAKEALAALFDSMRADTATIRNASESIADLGRSARARNKDHIGSPPLDKLTTSLVDLGWTMGTEATLVGLESEVGERAVLSALRGVVSEVAQRNAQVVDATQALYNQSTAIVDMSDMHLRRLRGEA